MDISTVSGYLVAIGIALLALASCPSCASAQAAAGSNVIILLRLAGDSGALPYLRSCLTSRLSAMPDTEVATAPSDGVRFIVDIIATKRAVEDVFASLVVAETFPLEQFRPRIKEGEDGDALLTRSVIIRCLGSTNSCSAGPSELFARELPRKLAIRFCPKSIPSVTTNS